MVRSGKGQEQLGGEKGEERCWRGGEGREKWQGKWNRGDGGKARQGDEEKKRRGESRGQEWGRERKKGEGCSSVLERRFRQGKRSVFEIGVKYC